MKIAVYAIAKNEAANVDSWVDNVGDADVIVACDTGSADFTIQAFNKRGLGPRELSIRPWRFDDARNAALALVPPDVDICIPLDLDERLSPGWRAAIERVWEPGITQINYRYIWSPDLELDNNRIHARHGYRWKYPTHEGIYPYFDGPVRQVHAPGLVIEQFQDRTKKRPNDMFLLAWGLFENPDDLRMLHYYGRELLWGGWPKEAARHLMRYLELEPRRPFPAERAATLALLRQCEAQFSQPKAGV